MDLVGELVRLRGPRARDASALLAIRSHPDVAAWGGPGLLLPTSVERARDALARRGLEQVRWVVELRQGGILGQALLHRLDYRNRNAWLTVELGPPERWGRGCGTEAIRLATRFAFLQLGLEKVTQCAYEGNARALAAYRRAGYEVEAELSRHHLLQGRLVTEYWLAAFRDHPLYAPPPRPGGRAGSGDPGY